MKDDRGVFIKTYHEGLFHEMGINRLEIKEEFFSISKKNVVRGMHFQLPPQGHEKFVYCIEGGVKDVLLDLRKGPNYGRAVTVDLTSDNSHMLFIPKGIAHGFLALNDKTIVIYKTSTIHHPNLDCGIFWDSFNFDWGISSPIISTRDQSLISFDDFISPF